MEEFRAINERVESWNEDDEQRKEAGHDRMRKVPKTEKIEKIKGCFNSTMGRSCKLDGCKL